VIGDGSLSDSAKSTLLTLRAFTVIPLLIIETKRVKGERREKRRERREKRKDRREETKEERGDGEREDEREREREQERERRDGERGDTSTNFASSWIVVRV
jgi:hypothetical protein